MLYSEKVIQHFKKPRNQGSLAHPSAVGRVGNPVCGDIMKIGIASDHGGYKLKSKIIKFLNKQKGKISQVTTKKNFEKVQTRLSRNCIPGLSHARLKILQKIVAWLNHAK